MRGTLHWDGRYPLPLPGVDSRLILLTSRPRNIQGWCQVKDMGWGPQETCGQRLGKKGGKVKNETSEGWLSDALYSLISCGSKQGRKLCTTG